MTNEALKSRYLAYIAAIKAHTTASTTDGSWSLEPYVNDQVLHNGQQITRADYEATIHNTYADVPDLHIDVHTVLASETEVAARLQFVGSPVTSQFLGWTPKEAGRREKVSFTDNVFYRFEGGKIKEVRSIVDTPKPL